MPDDLHGELTAAAERNLRSLNEEILARLAASVQPAALDVDELLARVQRRKAAVGPHDLTEASLRKLSNAGRP